MCSVGGNKKTFENIQQRLSEKIATLTVIYTVFGFLAGKNLTSSPAPAKFPRADKACAVHSCLPHHSCPNGAESSSDPTVPKGEIMKIIVCIDREEV